MMQKADFLKDRTKDVLFTLRIYEMYSKNMPSDILISQMCECYRRRYSALIQEYERECNSFTEVEDIYDRVQNQTC